MKKIGFPSPKMKDERRIALLPDDIARFISHPEFLFFAQGYGAKYGIPDKDYRHAGAHVIPDRATYSLDVLCQPKFCEADLKLMRKSEQVVFGWLHLVEDSKTTRFLEEKLDTAIAWEQMMYYGKNVFQNNGILTGEIGVLHAIAYAGKSPKDCSVAVIGRGRVGKGARSQLEKLGVKDLVVYHSKNSHLLRRYMNNYDVIVHCACSVVDILSKKDISKMKPGALFVHLGSDCIGGDFSANSIYSPVSQINHGKNLVYCVSHVPTLCYQTASRTISNDVAPYVDMLVRAEMNNALRGAVVIDHGISDNELLCARKPARNYTR